MITCNVAQGSSELPLPRLTLRRPAGEEVSVRAAADLPLSAAVYVNHEDVPGTAERDPRSVGRPGRMLIVLGSVTRGT